MSDSATPSSARLEETDLLRLRHLLGGLLVPVATWGLALVENASPVATLVALVVLCAGLVSPGWFAARGDRFWNFAGFGVVLVAVADLATTFLTDRGQFIPAVIRASLLIAVLRSLQPRTRREDMQLILLAMFLCAMGGALSLSPMFAVQVFLFIPLAGGVLFLLNRLDGGPRKRLGAEDWKNFSWRDFLRRIRRALTPGTMLFLGGAMIGVVLSGAVLFKALPRFRMDQAVPFLQMPGKGRTGFSDSVSLGGVGDILQDESVALRADTPDRRRPIANPYWRMIALDAYASGEATGTFSLSPDAERIFRRGEGRGAEWGADLSSLRGASPSALPGDWRVYYEGNVSKYLPAPGLARRIRFDKPQEFQENGALRTLRLQQQPSAGVPMLVSVTADSVRFPPTRAERARLDALTGPTRDYPGTLLGVPTDDASRTALAACVGEISSAPTDAVEFSTKAADWLHRRHAYALTDGYGRKTASPGEPKDYLVRWMRSEATGWCEHFASSFVLLARSAGHPARLVTGFAGGVWQENESYLVVQMKHAHAWAEIYDRRSGFWLRVDPTPVGSTGSATAAARDSIASYGGLQAWYDGLTMLWFRRVVNFEATDQREEWKAIGAGLKAWGATLSERVKLWRGALVDAATDLLRAPMKLVEPALATLAALATVFLLLRVLRKATARLVRRASDDDPRVRRFRERAGRALRALDTAASRGRPAEAAVRTAVETVRFGRPSEWPDPEAALAAVGPAIRATRRKS